MQEHNAPPRDELVAASVQLSILMTAVVQAGAAPRVLKALEGLDRGFDSEHIFHVWQNLDTVAGAMATRIDWTPLFDKIQRRRKERSQP